MTEQTKAQRLADWLDNSDCNFYGESSMWFDNKLAEKVDEAAAELRRLDALNAELVGVLNAIEVQCENIRKSDWRQWEELASPEEFEGWAKSRARQMAIAASEASAKAKEQT